MVNIPTARDVAFSSARSGRIANAGPTPMVGAAIADAGQMVVQAAYSLQELAEREKVDVINDRSNSVSTSLTRFLSDEEQRYLKAREESSESGIGFTRQFMEGHQQRANAFAKENFEGLSKDAQTGYLNNILSRGNSLYEKANAFERDAKTAYYDRTTNTNLDTYRSEIQNNAASFSDLKRQGLEAINSANMPEPWKAERRQKWEADAAESKWRWKFARDPKEALGEISGAGGDDAILAAIEDTESEGFAGAESQKGASGLMQVMPETGAEIASEIGDTSFPMNGSVEEQKAYLKDPAVSRQYGKYHYNKMLTRYDGDTEAALVAYNGGQVRADAWLAAGRDDTVIPKETADYYKKVLGKAKINTFTTQDTSQAKVFLLGRTGKDASHIEGMDDGFSVKLSRLIQAAPEGIRDKLGIYSGARTVERQAELWAAALKKYGSAEAARKWVAPPGKSNHNHGKAADLSFGGQSLKHAPADVVQWVHANAGRFGLKFPLANENWHIEDVSTRGGKSIPVDPDLASIPYERRQQLQSWGEAEYSQQVTKQRAATKDNYNLLIATEPDKVRESVILSDPTLDNGDKADLVKTLRTAQGESGAVNAMIGAMANGKVSVNAFSEEQAKVADKTYDKLLGAAEDADQQKVITSDFIARTGYIPKKVQAELRNGAVSTDPGTLSQAMEAGLVLSKNAPESFQRFEGSDAVRKKMDLYRAFTQDMGFSPEQAAQKLIKANDPQYAAQREALLKSKTVADELKKVDAASVAASFDNSFMGLAANPSLGPNELAAAAMVADYRTIYEEAIVDADGDLVAARKSANEQFQRSYGVSKLSPMGGNVVVKNPPEKAYPVGADGTHDYVRSQLAAALKEQGVEAEQVYLNPDAGTEQDIRAGRTPGYRVLYKKDGKLELFNFPFYADPDTAKAEAKKVSEQRMLKSRTAIMDDTAAGLDALAATKGSPDWIQAQAVEAARYKSMIDRARSEEDAVDPGPIGGSVVDDEMQPTPWNAM